MQKLIWIGVLVVLVGGVVFFFKSRFKDHNLTKPCNELSAINARVNTKLKPIISNGISNAAQAAEARDLVRAAFMEANKVSITPGPLKDVRGEYVRSLELLQNILHTLHIGLRDNRNDYLSAAKQDLVRYPGNETAILTRLNAICNGS